MKERTIAGMSTASLYVVPAPAGTVGGRIRQARRVCELSQAQLGALVPHGANGMTSRETIGAWETGRTSPPADALIAISEATGFGAAWFLDGLGAQPSGGPDGTPSDVTPRYPIPGQLDFDGHIIDIRDRIPA